MGWGAAPAAQPDDEGPAYDLGWVSQSPAPAVGMDVGSSGDAQDDDGPTYDLGWGAPSPASEVTADDNEDGQAYDLGWGIGHPDDDPMDNDIIVMKSEVEEEDETAHGVTQSDVIDLTSPEPRRTRRASPTPTENGSPSVDEQLAFRANRRMKAIGSDLTNHHMRAIIENAVYGLNAEQAPAHILMENRQVLASYADARNRITGIGQDMCKLHRLIELQRGLMRTVNNLTAYLEFGFLDLFGRTSTVLLRVRFAGDSSKRSSAGRFLPLG
ncbi:hypothetical protein P692DRAFT_20878741 [Suillus brevipes Sb2]|nr:hypothetical protein P692DRAFT_20878741 [Suillus brevipes Sb2]